MKYDDRRPKWYRQQADPPVVSPVVSAEPAPELDRARCFLVEATGASRELGEPGKAPFRMAEYEFKRLDTGETWWGWWASLGPGSMFIQTHEPGECWASWENCDGKHHTVVLPDGGVWDIDSRASNCGKRDDGYHRCWVRHGTAPNFTADKNGITCAAGAGSIVSGGKRKWHGYLRNGELAP